ncbi:MAG TPA: single-stranded-DNA-specific exonuclease RecJ [Patescibacteria group bacterium]
MDGGIVFARWEVLGKSEDLIDSLLESRGLKSKKEKELFLNPKSPYDLSLKELKISEAQVKKAAGRLKQAKKKNEKVIVYGDYDADGICSTAILWETLYLLGIDAMPFIPDRFSDGYGLSSESVKRLKKKNPDLRLIITVDNGIVANKAVETANKLGIDVIITDHHLPGKAKPKAYAVVHTTLIAGSAVSWVFSREILQSFKEKKEKLGLELVGIGTIADQLPLVGANRSFAKFGLIDLNKTKRPGFVCLLKDAGVKEGEVGTYEINYIIAPRINAMGRLSNGLDSLRLVCTKDVKKALDLAKNVNDTNIERQKLVDTVVTHARQSYADIGGKKIIVLSHESYHEGVIGLAASRLVEEFYRPSIVISTKGKIAKASARSISGFNIIETLRKLEDLWVEGGGHPMAAGFSIETAKISEFTKRLEELVEPLLTEELLTKKLRIDLETDFEKLNWDLVKTLTLFVPMGLGNPTPTFLTRGVEIKEVKPVGQTKKHLKLKLSKGGKFFDAIAFGFGEYYSELLGKEKVDVVYALEENVWNGSRSLQLRVKDLKVGS